MIKYDHSIDQLKQQLDQLAQVSAALEPTPEQREHYIQQLSQYAHDFIDHLHERISFKKGDPTPGSLTINETGQPFEQLLVTYAKEVEQYGIKPASGGHLGYIPGGGLYASSLGDYLADVTNEYAGIYFGSPGAVTLEEELLHWMKKVFGFPREAMGNLTSGGSIANLIALTAARDKYKVKSERIANSVIYLSPQVHHCVTKAIRIIGLEDVQIRYVNLDDRFRLDAQHLETLIEADKAAGLQPFLVIASAGTTDTGAVDPLEAIGHIAQKHQLWYHIDGAYGGFFILVDDKKPLFKGVELADSLVIDPHKSLFLPYGTGAVLIKDKEALMHSNHYTANYMQDTIDDSVPISPAEVSPELTKHFRGLRMWLPLQLHGLAPFVACLEEKLVLTDYFRKCLEQEGFKIGPTPDLSVSYFWLPADDISTQNRMNEQLMERIHQDGSVFLSSTSLDGMFVIRMAILAFRTKQRTIDKAMEMILRAKIELGF